jgi:putative endopeptidase
MKNRNQLVTSLLTVSVLAACTATKESPEAVTTQSKKETVTNATSPLKTLDLGYMDLSVKPQDDFFMYANGTWVKNNPIPPSESRWGSFNELEKANQSKLIGILDRAMVGKYDASQNASMLGNYYASYLNMEKRNADSWSAIKPEISRISAIKSNAELGTIIAEQHKDGINSLFGFGVGQDLKEVTKNITYFGQGGIGLPNKDYYTQEGKKEILASYQKHVQKMFSMIGYETSKSESASQNVVKFETMLAEKMMSPAELRIPENSYNKFTKEEWLKMMSNLNPSEYLKTVGSQDFKEIIIGQKDFTLKINEMLKSVDVNVWKDYLTWKTLNHYAGHLDAKFEQEHFNFYQRVLTGKSEMKPIKERVVNEITSMTIGESLGKLFVDQYYSEKAQERVNTMVDNLLLTFQERINGLTWMSAETKKEALIKLKSIGRKLGFPSKWEDFSDLKLTNTDYISNVKMCAQRDVRKNFEELNTPVDKEKWGMPAHMINAYYHPLLNEIAFPAGIMQAPFFIVDAEDAVNYGRIGMVIGHEFTHGFDDMGSKFAADGSFTNWWSESDRKLFEEKTAILGETFAGFCPIDGHCVNPELTMGENIADLGGITLAYYAYTKTDEFKSGKLVQGFTPAQRFFLSFAQLWKINYTEAELKNRIANDPHSPGMYRVNGPLMNCPEFFDAFQIKEGDKMRNKEQKVARIW